MNRPKPSRGLSDRIFAISWLSVCALIVYKMWLLEVPFVYEPMGPKPFPILLAGLMAICCVALLIHPDQDIDWPQSPQVIKGVVLTTILLGYASLFEILGFPFATLLMVMLVSRLFGGRWRTGLLSGMAAGILGYLLFDGLLQVTLPLGLLSYG